MRRPLVVGNWKMNGTQQSIAELLDAVTGLWRATPKVDVAVCAPYVYLAQVAETLRGSESGIQLARRILASIAKVPIPARFLPAC